MITMLSRVTVLKKAAASFVNVPKLARGAQSSEGPKVSFWDQELPDPVESTTGMEKKQLLALLNNDIRYEPKSLIRGPGTKDQPNIIPTHERSRCVACICEPENMYLNVMTINVGELKRCECGYWYKCVKSDPEWF